MDLNLPIAIAAFLLWLYMLLTFAFGIENTLKVLGL